MRVVCIPAFNSEKTIGDVIKKSLKYADKVIVCNDGSTDNTAKIATEHGAHVIHHEKNQGYGAAIISLFESARKENADIMVTLDSDGQHNPDEIPRLVNRLLEKNLDVVIGSRFLNGDSSTPSYRKTGIKMITSASNMGTFFKVRDSQSGFRAYSKKAIETINPTERGMAISTEILQKISNNGMKVEEVSITVLYGKDTSTQNAFKHGAAVFINTLKYISVKRPLTFYGVPGIILVIVGSYLGYTFLDAYLHKQGTFLGSLTAAIILFLAGTILCVTAVILFSMATMIRDRK